MKRLLAIIMAVTMLLSLNVFSAAVTVSAEEGATVDFSVPEYYNPGDVIDVVISFDSIAEAFGKGISTITLELHYSDYYVIPNVKASEDEDGDIMSFNALITESPEDWDGIGRLYEEDAYYDLAFTEFNAVNLVDTENGFTITVPFTVKDSAKIGTIGFDVTNVCVYDADITDCYESADTSAYIHYALQPNETVTVPDGALPLEVAGYKHEPKNVIYYAQRDITIGTYITSFIEITNNQQDMNYFGIIIVDSNNVITYVDTVIGRPQSDKSAVVIPEGSYIIGVNGNKTADLEAFKKIAFVGATVTLYNVNLEATGMVFNGTYLDGAAFTVSSLEPVVKEGALATYDSVGSVIRVYTHNLKIDDFKAMFENEFTVLDKNGEEVTSGIVKTGMTVDLGAGISIIVMGDCNSDGKVTALDYIRMKRHILRTYTLQGLEFEAARITGKATVKSQDYLVVKRVCLKTIEMSKYLPD